MQKANRHVQYSIQNYNVIMNMHDIFQNTVNTLRNIISISELFRFDKCTLKKKQGQERKKYRYTTVRGENIWNNCENELKLCK